MSEETSNGGSCDISSTKSTITDGINESGEYYLILDQSSDSISMDNYLKPSAEQINKPPSLAGYTNLQFEKNSTGCVHSSTEEQKQFQTKADLNVTSHLTNHTYCRASSIDKKPFHDEDTTV